MVNITMMLLENRAPLKQISYSRTNFVNFDHNSNMVDVTVNNNGSLNKLPFNDLLILVTMGSFKRLEDDYLLADRRANTNKSLILDMDRYNYTMQLLNTIKNNEIHLNNFGDFYLKDSNALVLPNQTIISDVDGIIRYREFDYLVSRYLYRACIGVRCNEHFIANLIEKLNRQYGAENCIYYILVTNLSSLSIYLLDYKFICYSSNSNINHMFILYDPMLFMYMHDKTNDSFKHVLFETISHLKQYKLFYKNGSLDLIKISNKISGYKSPIIANSCNNSINNNCTTLVQVPNKKYFSDTPIDKLLHDLLSNPSNNDNVISKYEFKFYLIITVRPNKGYFYNDVCMGVDGLHRNAPNFVTALETCAGLMVKDLKVYFNLPTDRYNPFEDLNGFFEVGSQVGFYNAYFTFYRIPDIDYSDLYRYVYTCSGISLFGDSTLRNTCVVVESLISPALTYKYTILINFKVDPYILDDTFNPYFNIYPNRFVDIDPQLPERIVFPEDFDKRQLQNRNHRVTQKLWEHFDKIEGSQSLYILH